MRGARLRSRDSRPAPRQRVAILELAVGEALQQEHGLAAARAAAHDVEAVTADPQLRRDRGQGRDARTRLVGAACAEHQCEPRARETQEG